jgi:galactokinase
MFIPGRIEIVGKHTDYCGGRSVVCAIDRGFHYSFQRNDSGRLTIKNRVTGEFGFVDIAERPVAEGPEWMLYPTTVVRSLTTLGGDGPLQGVDIEFESNLPMNAGLSSSSAFMITIFMALFEVNRTELADRLSRYLTDEFELATFIGGIESGRIFEQSPTEYGVGTRGGSQDHAAIICSKVKSLGCFSYDPVSLLERIVFPDDLVFVVAVSGVEAKKTGTAKQSYNRLSDMVSTLVSVWPGQEGNLREIIEGPGIDALERFISTNDFEFPKQQMIDRVRHFFGENFAITGEVLRLMNAGDFENIGGLIDLSQRNAERYLLNQVPETVFLQRTARSIGCLASSGFGAGFGGSVYAMVRRSDAQEFLLEWKARYLLEFPEVGRRADFLIAETSELKK